MNEEDLRMLQVAVGLDVDEAGHAESEEADVDTELLLQNMPADELERLIAQLEQPDQPVLPIQEQTRPAEAQNKSEAREKLNGAGNFNTNLYGDLAGIAELEELVRQSLVQPATNAVDHQSYNEPVKKEYNETELSADLERAIEEMSRSVTRINSPGPESLSQHSTPLHQANPHFHQHSARDEFQHNLESVVTALQQQQQRLVHTDGFRQNQSPTPNGSASTGPSQSTSPQSGRPQTSLSRGISRRSSSAGRNMCEDMDDPNKAAERERIREENRERKKRWREVNQDRNKDNDLRCRVTKRATKLFGPGETKEKMDWVNDEFNRRRTKREQKEKSRHEVPGHGPAGIYPPPRPEMNGFPSYSQPRETQSNEALAQEALDLLASGKYGSPTETMRIIIPYLMCQPKIVEELINMLRNRGHVSRVLQLQYSPSAPHQPLAPPVARDRPTHPEQNHVVEATPNDTPLHAHENLPDGFDALLAEVQKQLPPLLGEEEEKVNVSEPTAELPADLSELAVDIDDLLAQLGNADAEQAAISRANSESTGVPSQDNAVTADQISTPNVPDLDLLEDMDVEMTDELLELMLAEGVDLDALDLEVLAEKDMMVENELQEPNETDADATPVENYDGTGTGLESGDIDDLGDLPPEEVSRLLAELQDEIAELGDAPASKTLPSPIAVPQLPAAMHVEVPSPPTPPRSVESLSSPVPSAQASPTYDSETIATILTILMEPYTPPSVPNPQMTSFRGTKRSLSDHAGPAHRPKRIRGMTPNVPSAVSQLHGFLQTSEDVDIKPYQSSGSSQAQVSISGNNDAMNTRTVPLKPPPYRPVPSAASAPIPLPTVSSPSKKKEDEKKIKAMGFPPLPSGIKKAVS